MTAHAPSTWLAVAAVFALSACADEPPAQRAAADDCPTVRAPALTYGGGIAPYHGTGMLTQLKRKC